MRPFSRSFTLIELILVVAIVAVLAGALIPVIRGAREEAKISKLLQFSEACRDAARLYYSDTRAVPTGDRLVVNSGLSGWDGPYMDRLPTIKDHPFGDHTPGLTASLVRDGVTGKTAFSIVLSFANVPQSFAQKVDSAAMDRNIFLPASWPFTGKIQHGTTRFNGPDELSIRHLIAEE